MPRDPDRRPPAPAAVNAAARATLRENQRRLQRMMAIAIGAGLALDAVVVIVAWLSAGRPQLLGALLGTALAAVILVPTWVVVRMGAQWSPQGSAAGILGSWLLKMAVLVVTLAALGDSEAVAPRWVGIALLTGAFLGLLIEVLLLARLKPRLEVAQGSDD